MRSTWTLLIALAACDGSPTPHDSAAGDGAAPDTATADATAGGDAASDVVRVSSDSWIQQLEADRVFTGVSVASDRGELLLYGNRRAVGGFVAKYSNRGQMQWSAELGAGHVAGLQVERDGRYLVTGFGTTDFNRGQADGFLARFGADGTMVFRSPLGYSYARAIGAGADTAGHITLVGMAAESTTRGWDILLARFDASGSRSSTREYPDSIASYVKQAMVDGDGNAYVRSSSASLPRMAKLSPQGEVLWGVSTEGPFTLDAQGNLYLVAEHRLFKYAPDGTKLSEWMWTSQSSRIGDEGYAVAVSPGGQIAVAGAHVRRDSFNRLQSAQSKVVVLDASGTIRGSRSLLGEGIHSATSVAFASETHLYIGGAFQRAVGIEPDGIVRSESQDSSSHYFGYMLVPRLQ